MVTAGETPVLYAAEEASYYSTWFYLAPNRVRTRQESGRTRSLERLSRLPRAYLGLVEHHLIGGELGHRAGPVDAGDPAGAPRAKACKRGAPAHYMRESRTRLLTAPLSRSKSAARPAGKRRGSRDPCGTVRVPKGRISGGLTSLNGNSFAAM